MSWVRVGTTVLDRYVLVRLIGQGGVSLVYEAIDTVAGRSAAVKLPSKALANDPRTRECLHREAALIDRLRHPTVPRIYHIGDTLLPPGEVFAMMVPCLAMELLTGTPLTQRMAAGALPWRSAIEVTASLAETLAVAHRRGIVHRDLAPDNVLITPTGGVKLVDFGLAAIADRSVVADTGYDARAEDVHALGILLYQLLTGRSPYPNATPGDHLAAARTGRAAPAPVLAVADLPAVVSDVCRGCLAKRPEDRPDSATVALALWSALFPDHRPHATIGPIATHSKLA